MTTAHELENAIASRLDRQVNPIAKVRVLLDGGNDVRVKIAWERGRKLDSRQASGGNGSQQAAERRRARETFESIFNSRAVTVDVLADEMNFFLAKRLQALRLGDDLACRAAALAST